jgi:16S rRNA (guanine527-N7)-methyltransferase
MNGNMSDRLAGLNVSRETFERLELFAELLIKWNSRINLVSRSSLAELWTRHIIDSVQVFNCAGPTALWADLGSGGGFPGLVVAILAKEQHVDCKVVLIESDQRKAAFLRTVTREVGLDCQTISQRIEVAPPQNANIVSARALAELSVLLQYSERHLAKGGIALFPKGVTWQKELTSAQLQWRFDVDVIESQTMSGAAILKIEGATRV